MEEPCKCNLIIFKGEVAFKGLLDKGRRVFSLSSSFKNVQVAIQVMGTCEEIL